MDELKVCLLLQFKVEYCIVYSLRKHLEFDELFDTSMAWELPICSVELPNNPFTMDHLTV